jgi:hypothetical protein
MYRMTKSNGLVFIVVPTTGYPEHGTSNKAPSDSPLTIAKGWEYYNSKAGNSETYNEVSWSFGLEPYNDKAKGWLTLYTYEGLPSKIWFQVFSKKIFTQIETSIASAGFKLM